MIDSPCALRLIRCMHGTAQSLGTAIFALRHAFSDGITTDLKLVACLGVTALLLWEPWQQFLSWCTRRCTGQRLRYEEDGRSGRIWYENGRSRFDMYWEFGGGNTLVVIDVPSETEWVSRTGLPLAERTEVLRYIATQVIRDKTSTGRNRYDIGPAEIRIFE